MIHHSSSSGPDSLLAGPAVLAGALRTMARAPAPRPYGEDSTEAGSTAAAFRAGTQQARIATPKIPAAATPSVAAPVPVTPQR